MSSIKLKGSSSGDVTITVPAAAGTNTVTIPAATGNLPLSNLDHVTNRPTDKPFIHNGDMAIAQRTTSTSSVTGNHYGADRFTTQFATFGTWTVSQASDAPAGTGLVKSFKLDCTTADTSLGAGDFGLVRTSFEGFQTEPFKKGSSDAYTLTVAFWVKSAKTGNYVLELFDTDNSRQISKIYTISSADTWEKKILNFAADTSASDPFNYDNAESFVMNWWLGAGSTYSGGTLNTSAWADNTNANRAAGVLNLADSTDNDWYLTGVQLEFGTFDSTTLPPFQFESYGDNLKRCQRYCQKYLQPSLVGVANATQTVARASMTLQTPMRTGPTASQTGGNFVWFNTNSHQPQSSAFAATYTDENTFECDVTMTATGNTVPSICKVYQSGNGYLLLTADLMAG